MTKSQVFFLSSLAFIMGIFIGSYYSIPVWTLFFIAAAAAPFVFLFKNKKRLRIFFALFVIFLLGFARIEGIKLKELEILRIENLDNKILKLEGVVSSIPEIKDNKQRITLENLENKNDSSKINRKILVYANRYPEYRFKDKIEIEGKISLPENFDGFDYENYLRAKGIYYISYYPKITLKGKNKKDFYGVILGARSGISDLMKEIISQPQAGIMNAVILGSEADISKDVLENFNKTGTRHIFAVSGSNITLVSVALMYFLLALGLKRDYAFYFAVLGVLCFVLIVGFPASAVRAAVMGIITLFAVKVGRLSNMTNAIIFAAALMLIYNPFLLKYDVGFQLSFIAVLGLIYIFPRLNKSFEKYGDFYGLKAILLLTVSAQIAVLPIILSAFENFSLFSVLANVMILPFVPLITISGFIITAIGAFNLFVAQIVSWPIWLVVFYQMEVVKFFSGFSFASVDFGKFSGFWIIAYYSVLVLILNNKKISSALSRNLAVIIYPMGNPIFKFFYAWDEERKKKG